jgi:regulator of protease activity HflC (stomatin/prohibitin superfamily)
MYHDGRDHNVFGYMVVVLIAIVAICAVFGFFTTSVPAGSVGIQNVYGDVSNDTLKPGFHIKAPWVDVIPMSMQTTKYMDYEKTDVATITGLSNEAMKVTVGIAVTYHLNPDKAVEVYKNVGTKYEDKVLRDPIHTVPRDVVSQYDAKTLYSASTAGTADRLVVEARILSGLRERIETVGVPNSITVEQVYVRNIDFPPEFTNARTDQMNMETKIKTKENEVRVQEKEADRMRAEAQGIADANKIISGSLTQNYLEWYTIEMMKQHSGATYFMPIDSTGRVNPTPVVQVGKEA